jgi:hypothetical protein
MAFDGKSLTTKVLGLDDTLDLDMWKAQFESRRLEIWPPKCQMCRQVQNQIDYLLRLFWESYLHFEYQSWI